MNSTAVGTHPAIEELTLQANRLENFADRILGRPVTPNSPTPTPISSGYAGLVGAVETNLGTAERIRHLIDLLTERVG